jgi:hypothetical protein
MEKALVCKDFILGRVSRKLIINSLSKPNQVHEARTIQHAAHSSVTYWSTILYSWKFQEERVMGDLALPLSFVVGADTCPSSRD